MSGGAFDAAYAPAFDVGVRYPGYVDRAELARLVGSTADDERLGPVCDDTDMVVDHYYGSRTVAAKLRDTDGNVIDPVPACVARAALTIAVDLWRRPTLPGGYVQLTDYVGRLAQDPTSSVTAELNALGRLGWGVA